MSLRVAFQGEQGAFSEEAARSAFHFDIEPVSCRTFELLIAAVPEGKADQALVPLENTLAGHVVRCYDLLYETDLKIVGEIVRPIHHCLIGCQGSSVGELREVQSHPVALAQCERFFAEHPTVVRRVAEDTAGSVRDLMEKRDLSVGAIAGEHAASVYGAQVLRRNIEDYPENFTRFVLLGDGRSGEGSTDKQSLAVKLWHEPGSLFRALQPFASHNVNLVNLLCRPLKRTPWHYLFFVDLVAPEESRQKAIEELSQFAEEVRVLGCYKAAAKE